MESAFTTLCRVQMTTEISIGMDSALDRGGAVAIVVRVKQTFDQLRGGLHGPEVNVRRGLGTKKSTCGMDSATCRRIRWPCFILF